MNLDLEKMAKIVFQPNGRQGEVPAGTSVLEAARRLGVEIESICGGHQTCGKCKVVLETGHFSKFDIHSTPENVSSRGEREERYAQRYRFTELTRLSCACSVQGDIVVRVPEESQVRKQVVRKDGLVTRVVEVDAGMRLFYVEMAAAELKDHRGDWERLQARLEEVHGLRELKIDLSALRALQPALAQGRRSVTVTVFDNRELIRVQPGYVEDLFGIAVDVGTTTLAGHLCHLRTGEILVTGSRMNPQVPYGEDLMSRISYAMVNDDGVERMHQAIIDGLNELIAGMCSQSGVAAGDIVEMVLVGNTTMHHLLLGINPQELGGSPFSLATHDPINVKARDLGLKIAEGANAHFPPCEAGHVGSDNVGVLVAEAPYRQNELALIVDIGTNGEILLGNQERVLSASSPTGPAFEGAQILNGMRAAAGAIERVRIDPATLDVQYRVIGLDEWHVSENLPVHIMPEAQAVTGQEKRGRRQRQSAPLRPAGICGSGIIEAVGELMLAGLLGPNGRFVEISHPRLRLGLGEGGAKAEFVLVWGHESSSGEDIVVHADDIRAIQLAKAALYAGVKLLMQRLDVSEVARVALAGGFGSYIDPKYAVLLGLVPDCPLERIQAVGNAAGDGARMILLDRRKRAEATWAARWVTYVETAVEPAFQEEFVQALGLPHSTDDFPQVQLWLEAAQGQWTPERLALYQVMTAGGQGGRKSGSERSARREQRAQRKATTAGSEGTNDV
jgi:uncharacterized 2Fe-2S/4Fe-4S cluster protein (DUF4445 family)